MGLTGAPIWSPIPLFWALSGSPPRHAITQAAAPLIPAAGISRHSEPQRPSVSRALRSTPSPQQPLQPRVQQTPLPSAQLQSPHSPGLPAREARLPAATVASRAPPPPAQARSEPLPLGSAAAEACGARQACLCSLSNAVAVHKC